jgi:hypothetical protein
MRKEGVEVLWRSQRDPRDLDFGAVGLVAQPACLRQPRLPFNAYLLATKLHEQDDKGRNKGEHH